MIENPKGVDGQERRMAKNSAIKAKADLEQRFKTAKKYRDDPEILALLGIKQEKPKAKEKKNAIQP